MEGLSLPHHSDAGYIIANQRLSQIGTLEDVVWPERPVLRIMGLSGDQ